MTAPASANRLLLLLLSHLLHISATLNYAAEGGVGEDGAAYQRYSHYPPYCSTPTEMARRSVPPLRLSSETDVGLTTQLVHVTAVIRHGARTPYAGPDRLQCWDSFWSDPSTGVWDCTLTTLSAPPSDPTDPTEEVLDGEDGGKAFLYEKRYDGLPRGKNVLNGTCLLGQLIDRGYVQELTNGKHLRNAYALHDDTTDDHAAAGEHMRLFDLTTALDDGGNGGTIPPRPYEAPYLYLRGDDEQRTLMSGQVLLLGLFGDELRQHKTTMNEDPVVVLHTADYNVDSLTAKSLVCPRLDDLKLAAETSPAFRAFNSSDEADTLRTMMETESGQTFENGAIDCLMTALCTDRPLPLVLDDYGKEGILGPGSWNGNGPLDDVLSEDDWSSGDAGSSSGSSSTSSSGDGVEEGYGLHLFERLFNFAVQLFNFHFVYDGAAYSKLGMGPLWEEILANIVPIVRPSSGGQVRGSDPPKLALFSGHDTTLMPLLATLGPDVWDGTEWTPYASMILIEVHQITGRSSGQTSYASDFAFRLLYNGEVLTPRMEDCPADSDLCDVEVLLEIVEPFAKTDRDCVSSIKPDQEEAIPASPQSTLQHAEAVIMQPAGIVLLVVLVLASFALGGLATYVYMTRHLPCRRKPSRNYSRGLSLTAMKGASIDDDGDDDKIGNGHLDREADKAVAVTSVYGAADTEAPRLT